MGNKSSTATAADLPQPGPAQTETDVTRLIHFARLLTASAGADENMISVQTIMNLPLVGCDAYAGAYVDLAMSMMNDPPTYAGDDPITDITTVLSQMISCVKATRSVGTKIADFFKGNDGGAKIRRLLVLSKVIIECLALWYAMKKSGLLGDSGTPDFQAMQGFCRRALAKQSVSTVEKELIPAALRDSVNRATQWNGSLSTVLATFSIIGQGAPVLLIFNESALEAAMQSVEQTGTLPPQVATEQSVEETGTSAMQAVNGMSVPTGTSSAYPVTFVPRADLKPFVDQYLGSGPVAEAPQPVTY